MTEAEWHVCADPEATLSACLQRGTVRKARLLAVACCYRLVSYLPLIAGTERDDLLNALCDRADQPIPDNWTDAICDDYDFVRTFDGVDGFGEIVDSYMMITAGGLAGGLKHAKYAAEGNGAQDESSPQAALIRCLFGNPFRPVAFSPEWRTDTAVALACQMYESREFGAMPILADALQDAGCEDEQILLHCRDTNTTHVRGCWVVDLVLGKE
jgi:hypothetical protein